MGAIATVTAGQEEYEIFYNGTGSRRKKYYQYDYRTEDGELFSCVKPTLGVCRIARDEWLKKRSLLWV